MIEACNMLK